MNTSNLVNLALKGDNAARTELYNLTCDKAFSLALQMTKNKEEAEDILHDSYIKAFSSLQTMTNAANFPSWFYCIVSNKCKDYLKSKRRGVVMFSDLEGEDDNGDEREFELEDTSEDYSPEANADVNETARLIREMIDNLPEDQRMVVIMYYLNRLTIKEIAQALDVSENTVKSRLRYAKQKLKLDVEELERNGTKLYGIGGGMLFAFIIWLLKTQAAASNPPAAATVVSNLSTVADTVSDAANVNQIGLGNEVQRIHSTGSVQKINAAKQAHYRPTTQVPETPTHYRPTTQVPDNPSYYRPTNQVPETPTHYRPTTQVPDNPSYYRPASQVPEPNAVSKAAGSAGKAVAGKVAKKGLSTGVKALIIGLGATVVAGGAVAGVAVANPDFRAAIDVFGWFGTKSNGSPESTVKQFEEAFNNHDYDAMTKTFTPAVQEKLSSGSESGTLSGLYKLRSAFDSYLNLKMEVKVNDVSYSGDNKATVDVNINRTALFGSKNLANYKLDMVKIDGKWYFSEQGVTQAAKLLT